MPRRLRNLRISEGSFVTRGDNPGANLVIFKAHPADLENVTMTTDALLAVIKGLDATERDALLKDFLPADRSAEIETLKAEIETLKAEKAEDAKTEDVAKADLPEDVRKMLDAERDQRAKLEKALEEIVAERELAKALAKAQGYDLGIEAAALAPILVTLEKALAPEQLAEVERVFKACSALREKGVEIGKAKGTDAPAATPTEKADAQARLDQLAKERAKADGTTFAKAYVAVLSDPQNAALYRAVHS